MGKLLPRNGTCTRCDDKIWSPSQCWLQKPAVTSVRGLRQKSNQLQWFSVVCLVQIRWQRSLVQRFYPETCQCWRQKHIYTLAWKWVFAGPGRTEFLPAYNFRIWQDKQASIGCCLSFIAFGSDCHILGTVNEHQCSSFTLQSVDCHSVPRF